MLRSDTLTTVAGDAACAGQPPRPVPVRVLRTVLFAAFGLQAALGNAWNVAFGLPAPLKWLDEGIVLVLAALLLVRTVALGRLPMWKLTACVDLAAFTTIALASGVVNNAPSNELVLGCRSLEQFFLFYIVLVWLDVEVPDLRHFFTALLVGGLVHVPLALRQLRAAPAGYLGIDALTGGFGAGTANLLGYFCGVVVLVALCQGLVGHRWRYGLLGAPIVMVWPFTSANGSYIAVACVLALAVMLSRDLRRFRHLFRYAAIAAVIVVSLSYVVNNRFRVSLASSLLSPIRALTVRHIDAAGNPGRIALLSETAGLLAEHDRTLLFGLGTGSVATLLGGAEPSNFARFSARTGARFVSASFIGFFAELGLLGVIVIMLAWLRLGWIAWRALRGAERQSAGSIERAWLLAALLIVPFAVLAGCGEVAWIFKPVMYPVGALVAFATVDRASRSRRSASASRRADAVSECG